MIATVAFDGRLSFKQYVPKKPTKPGRKLWCLSDSYTGYCVTLDVYTGTKADPAVNLDLGYRVTIELLRNHLLRYHHVFADNFRTSVHLAEDLSQADTYLCGTTRATRREFPNTVAFSVLKQGVRKKDERCGGAGVQVTRQVRPVHKRR